MRAVEDKTEVLAKFWMGVSGREGAVGPDAKNEGLSWARPRPFDVAPPRMTPRTGVPMRMQGAAAQGRMGSHALLGRLLEKMAS